MFGWLTNVIAYELCTTMYMNLHTIELRRYGFIWDTHQTWSFRNGDRCMFEYHIFNQYCDLADRIIVCFILSVIVICIGIVVYDKYKHNKTGKSIEEA